ncbi:MAG: phosphodiesterase [Veillonellaceae bacterium]|nr:phosphodiesterase [Veillonellaceae bacterium]
MKWVIASDIHGSAFYCKKLLQAYEEEKGERLILLGDILYHGPRNDLPADYAAKAVIKMLNAHKDEILAVRGNCDAEVDQMVLDFPLMADYAVLPLGNRTVYMTHGHIYNEGHLPPLKEGDILLHGHTHVPACVEHDKYVYMNPGSTSIPKQGSWHGYMVLSDDTFIWKDFEGKEHRRYSVHSAANK